ncbi:MAG: hypothetical protein VX228_12985, partial [Pseudomonadota bacterium]|nr:hypothetical protein [Pseudomonadota bacterium]
HQSDQSHQNEAYLDPSMLQLAVFAELSFQVSVAFWHFWPSVSSAWAQISSVGELNIEFLA